MDNSTLKESELYKFLGQYGIKTPECNEFGLNDSMHADSFPLVLKIQSPKVVHKSDVGGVILNINSNEELLKAKEKMIDSLKSHNIHLDSNDGFIATQMIGGEELYIGVVDDDVFGHTILLGKGGIHLELYKDICYIDSQASVDEIKRAFQTTKISKLFDGFRGSKHNIDEVVKLVQSVQNLIKQNPNIKELDINPLKLTNSGLVAVDARIQRGEIIKKDIRDNKLRPNFLENKNVAIVGASTDQTKTGYAIAKNSLSFSGNVFFVNQKGGSLFDKPLLKSIDEIKGDIDTAVLVIPAKFVIPTIKDLIPRGLKNLIVITAGFKESGHEQEEIEINKLARAHNINVLGPNCLGIYESTTKLNLTFGTSNIHAGEIALISQSGAVLAALMDKAYSSNIGFSHLMSLGNTVDITSAELITMLDNSPSAKHISIYLEGISNGKELIESIRNCSKEIFLYKSGQSDESRKAAFSHTGNLSGNYDMFYGLMKSLGVNVVDNIEALIFQPHFFGTKDIAIITNAGGPGTVLTDCIVHRGKKLYELTNDDIQKLNKGLPEHWSHNNPIDIIGDALADRYLSALEAIDDNKNIDLIYLLITPQEITDPIGSVKILKQKQWKHKVVPILIGGDMIAQAAQFCRENKIIYFESLTQATMFL